jgi:hypothetical protein
MMNVPLRPLSPSDASAAAALIRAAFADQGAVTVPPSSALRETARDVEEKLAKGGGIAADDQGELIGLLLWTPQFRRRAAARAWRRG